MRDGASTEAEEIQRIVSASVRDLLDAFRIQAAAGPGSPTRCSRSFLFRAPHGVLQSLAPYPREQRAALHRHALRPARRRHVGLRRGALGRTPEAMSSVSSWRPPVRRCRVQRVGAMAAKRRP
jgi:hypothetical protein